MPAADSSSHIIAMVVVAVAVSAASVLGGLFLWKKAGSTRSAPGATPAKKSSENPTKSPLNDVPAAPNGSTRYLKIPSTSQAPPAAAKSSEDSTAPPQPPKAAARTAPAAGGAAILARLKADRAKAAAAADARKKAEAGRKTVSFVFASQTGTAEEIAKSLHDEAVSKKYKSRCMSINEWAEAVNIDQCPVVVFICSTTGDGDPPDNSGKGLIKLKSKTALKTVSALKYTVMGLGDSNYTAFMRIPRTVARRMRDLGATEFYACKEADEVDGLEDIVDAWRDDLWGPLSKAIEAGSSNGEETKQEENGKPATSAASLPADFTVKGNLVDANAEIQGVPPARASNAEIELAPSSPDSETSFTEPTEQAKSYHDDSGRYSEEQPFWSQVKECKLMTARECPKRVFHMSLDITASDMTFLPGDAAGVCPGNDPSLVDSLLEHLKLDGSLCIKSIAATDGGSADKVLHHIRRGCTLRQALTWCCDITTPPAKFALAALAECTTNDSESATLRFLSSRDGRDAYKADITTGRPSLLQLLKRYPSCMPPATKLLSFLPPLRPRLYSLTNSQLISPTRLEFAFHVVEYDTHCGNHGGVATSWLERDCAEGKWLPVHMRPPTGFRPPEEPSTPVIMVGPGTGVAPFRGFLQHLSAAKADGEKIGESWLFFGNWRRDWDYLFEQEFAGFVEEGVLSHMHVAWSRESDTKVYVQDKIRENGQALCNALVKDGASLFLCGDGAHMAKDVHAAFVEILVTHGGAASAEKAEAFMKELATNKRYLKDVWLA